MASTTASGDANHEPTFDFKPVKKIDLDLFAPAPQVRKMSRKEKSKLRYDLEMSKRKDDLVEEKKLNSHELFASVFSPEEAENEIAAAQRQKKSKPQLLRHAIHKNEEEDQRTIFVGNISNVTTRKEVKGIFKDCGAIESVRIRCQMLTPPTETGKAIGRAIRVLRGDLRKDEKSTATAYVLFREESSIPKALEKNSLVFNGRHIVVTSLDREDAAYPPETSIFLGNVAYDTTEEEVWDYFALHGIHDIKRVRLVRDRDSGNCKGFGYVEFINSSSVKKAIETRGNILNGRELRIVHVNKPKSTGNSTSRRELRKSQAVNNEKSRKRPSQDDGKEKKRYRSEQEQMPWMGMVTNPRRKIPRDLRPLVDGKKDKPRVAHAPVKRKARNPEK